MERFETKVEEGTLYVEDSDGWLKIGRFEDIYDLIGGREYTLEYDQKAAQAAWLDTDEDNTITFDVRDHLEEMTYTRDFVENIANVEMEKGEDGYPKRTVLFVDLMTEIWETKGNLTE